MKDKLHMGKKALLIGLSLLIIWSGMPPLGEVLVGNAEQLAAVDEKVSVLFAGGDGSLDSPFIIKSAEQLYAIRDNLQGHYQLGSDIDLSANSLGTNWQAIGDINNPFNGSFDGQGYVITGLTITSGTTDYQGMFGVIGMEGLVENVQLEEVTINLSSTDFVGSLVGWNDGEVRKSYATGKVLGDSRVGGLVGRSDGEIIESYATGTVTGRGSSIGGLVGESGGEVIRSSAKGTVLGGSSIGGLIGVNFTGAVIRESYFAGDVSGNGQIGGLAGIGGGEISQSYVTGTVSGADFYAGGLVGRPLGSVNTSFWNTSAYNDHTPLDNGIGIPVSEDEMKRRETFTDWNFTDTWYLYNGDTLPFFQWEDPLEMVEVQMAPTILISGDTAQIAVTAKHLRDSYHATLTAAYTVTEGKEIVSVNQEGQVHATSSGKATITASLHGKDTTIDVDVYSYMINRIEQPTTITVPNGTTIDEIGLSDTVQVVVSPNDSKRDIAVEWTDADEANPYQATVPGTYTFTGSLVDLPEEIGNPESLTATVDVVVNHKLIDVPVTKVWNDGKNAAETRPDSVTVDILQNGIVLEDRAIELSDGNDWVGVFEGLYAVDSNGELYEYTVEERDVENYQRQGAIVGNADDGFTITNVETTEVKVQKIWQDDNNATGDRPDQIKVLLYQNGESLDEAKILAKNNWVYTFTNLPVYSPDGETYEYAVEEEALEGYEQKDSQLTADGFEITNVRTGKKDIRVTKKWLDEDSSARPEEITLKLYQNGSHMENLDAFVSSEDNWEYVFDNLPEYDKEGKVYKYTVEEEPVEGYEQASMETVEDNVIHITNVRTGKMDIHVIKNWIDTDETAVRPNSITVQLVQEGDEQHIVDTAEIEPDTDGNWNHIFTNIAKYDKAGRAIEYTVKEQGVPGYNSTVKSIGQNFDNFEITNVRAGTTVISGTKTWLDNNAVDRPESITVQLTRSGDDEFTETMEVNKADNWEYSFGGLSWFNEKGEAYEYYINELNVDERYKKTIYNYNITNTRIGTISVEGKKKWLDEEETANRPGSITVFLSREGDDKFKQTKEITEEDAWSYSFKNLDQYDNQGIEYVYIIDEAPVEGYEKKINRYDITNIRSKQSSLTVTKEWKDDNNATNHRPDYITIELYRSDNNHQAYESTVISSSDDWQHTFENLSMFDEKGHPYTYEVKELPVYGYKTIQKNTGNGVHLTNIREGKISIDVTKQWNDNANVDSRPEEIEVELYRSDNAVEPLESAIITADDDGKWLHRFTDIDAFDKEGVAYTFTVKEKPVNGYKLENIIGDMQNGFVMTNVLTTSVQVAKEWLDDGDETERPDEITVELYRNGEYITETIVDASKNWQYTFENLEVYDSDKNPYTYTVKEKNHLNENYQLSGITGSVEDGFVIRNVRVGTTSVAGTKTWNDNNSVDRPNSITIHLLQNNSVIETKNATAGGNWEYSFTDLEMYDEYGVAYEYSVTEQDIPGYNTEVIGYDILNTRSEQKSIEIIVGWKDDNPEGRPDAITVSLLQNGAVFETVEVTAENGWIYEFANLEAYNKDGAAYIYTIEEEPVEGYETTVNGFNITNLRVGTTTVEGTKTWAGDNAVERPDSIIVELLRNGEVIATRKVTAADDWKYSFTNLSAFDGSGVSYIYTVEEQKVPGYESTVDGYDITNKFIPEISVSDKPEKPADNADDKTVGVKEGAFETQETDKESQLPKTSTNIFHLIIIGIGLLMVGAAILLAYRRKVNT